LRERHRPEWATVFSALPSLAMGCATAKPIREPTVPAPWSAEGHRRCSNKYASPPFSDNFCRNGDPPSGAVRKPDDTKCGDGSTWTVMGKYRMKMARDDIMGEGASSICRRATSLKTGDQVAVKVYKSRGDNSKNEDVKLQKFRRQIQVLKELQEPFQVPSEVSLWSEHLAHAKPSRLFMQLFDYSRDADDTPGPDPRDDMLYVVTELAQYSLKDYLVMRRDQNKPLPRESVRTITKAIILVMAGLHSKGLVHIDLKPENLMMFNGRLKLIDVDGCIRAKTPVNIQDSSISFSPCYCSPEWARFLIEDNEPKITVTPALDVWSVGMTVCELVTLDALLKPIYVNSLRNGHSHKEAGFLFMDWLSKAKKVSLPKTVESFDPAFVDLLVNWLLVIDPKKRKSCAQCLSHPYLASVRSGSKRLSNGEAGVAKEPSNQENTVTVEDPISQVQLRNRLEDTSGNAPVFKSGLWKLDAGGDVKDRIQWRRRDAWINSDGSLCYFSITENKRLVLIDGSKLMGAEVSHCNGAAREHAFSVQLRSNVEGGNDPDGLFFACDSHEEYETWTARLRRVVNMDEMQTTMRLGAAIQTDLAKFRLNVKNRRMVIRDHDKDNFAPVFKAKLWKVKAEGNRNKEEDWFERDMWLSKNGSLVYWSKKEERELVYYTTEDIMKASFRMITNDDSFRAWAFAVQLPPCDNVEFAPGEFAAESQEMRDEWLKELRRFQREASK